LEQWGFEYRVLLVSVVNGKAEDASRECASAVVVLGVQDGGGSRSVGYGRFFCSIEKKQVGQPSD
jgi:hypothetical protein